MLGQWHSLSLSWDVGLVEKCPALPEWTVEFTPHNKDHGEKVQLASYAARFVNASCGETCSSVKQQSLIKLLKAGTFQLLPSG